MLTATELLEAALPSAAGEPGTQPLAPSQQRREAPRSAGPAQALGLGPGAGRSEEAAVLAAVGERYSRAVEQREVEEMRALLGAEHLHLCQVHA